MPGEILTTASTIMCPHGGSVILSTANSKVLCDGMPALLESDVHQVAGCPFMMGTKYSPCIRVEWAAGASMVKVNGTPVLVKSSTGKCFSAENAMQGMATIVNTQQKVSGK